MHAQLQAVRGLLQLLDPELHAHLVSGEILLTPSGFASACIGLGLRLGLGPRLGLGLG